MSSSISYRVLLTRFSAKKTRRGIVRRYGEEKGEQERKEGDLRKKKRREISSRGEGYSISFTAWAIDTINPIFDEKKRKKHRARLFGGHEEEKVRKGK